MRSNLANGKLIPPGSPVAAQVRHQQLVYEIDKIERDPVQRDRASGCLGWLREEEKQLSAWMQAHDVQAIRPGPSAVPTAAVEKTEEDFAAFWRE